MNSNASSRIKIPPSYRKRWTLPITRRVHGMIIIFLCPLLDRVKSFISIYFITQSMQGYIDLQVGTVRTNFVRDCHGEQVPQLLLVQYGHVPYYSCKREEHLLYIDDGSRAGRSRWYYLLITYRETKTSQYSFTHTHVFFDRLFTMSGKEMYDSFYMQIFRAVVTLYR